MHRPPLKAPRCAIEGTAGVRRRGWEVHALREHDGGRSDCLPLPHSQAKAMVGYLFLQFGVRQIIVALILKRPLG
jgi:hypothetical protein